MTRPIRHWLAAAALCAACGPSGTGDGNGNANPGGDVDGAPGGGEGRWPDAGDPGGGGEFVDAAPAQKCEKMDILFVVDNSGSMVEEQANLAANFPKFIDVLNGIEDLDYRVGVTTTGRDYTWNIETPIGPIPSTQDGGDNGTLLQRCGMTRPWVEKADPDVASTFACAAEVGDQGPASEMPLAVIKQAFSERISDGTNAGFLRDDALLGVVILTDENDCSYEDPVTFGLFELMCEAKLEPVSTYSDFLDGLTGGAGRWAAAVIAGPGPGQCSSDFGSAAEATRLKEFVSLGGDNAVFSSICEGDLTLALQQALETFDLACEQFPPID